MYIVTFVGMRYQTPSGIANPQSLIALALRVMNKAEVDHAVIEKDYHHQYQLSSLAEDSRSMMSWLWQTGATARSFVEELDNIVRSTQMMLDEPMPDKVEEVTRKRVNRDNTKNEFGYWQQTVLVGRERTAAKRISRPSEGSNS